eukprot:TRINITY_DN3265_c0_g1_i1.p1 TRINITY_DN3265_c0_g1~~TRINITY_DN3265_c0_g1_i1.p1  ORF type:complete len:304 (+),score=46.12 TRINITY_DN3265_c0_g1_i1:119-913(+)
MKPSENVLKMSAEEVQADFDFLNECIRNINQITPNVPSLSIYGRLRTVMRAWMMLNQRKQAEVVELALRAFRKSSETNNTIPLMPTPLWREVEAFIMKMAREKPIRLHDLVTTMFEIAEAPTGATIRRGPFSYNYEAGIIDLFPPMPPQQLLFEYRREILKLPKISQCTTIATYNSTLSMALTYVPALLIENLGFNPKEVIHECVCSAPGTKKCSRCGQQRYCSAACQKAHWPHHKLACAPAKVAISVDDEKLASYMSSNPLSK